MFGMNGQQMGNGFGDTNVARAKAEIEDALGKFNLPQQQAPQQMQPQYPAQPQMQPPAQQPNPLEQLAQMLNYQRGPGFQQGGVSMPMGGGLSAFLQMMQQRGAAPQGTMGANYQTQGGANFGVNYSPEARRFGANMRLPFARGGFAAKEDVPGYANGGEIVVTGDRGASSFGPSVQPNTYFPGWNTGRSFSDYVNSVSSSTPRLAAISPPQMAPEPAGPTLTPAVIKQAATPLQRLAGGAPPRAYGARFSVPFARGGFAVKCGC